MMVEVEVISTDSIKPSSPTPPHLRHYTLSFLDQISPPIYMPLLLFFATPAAALGPSDPKLGPLRRSLSAALTTFYPLAGRISYDDRDAAIDCNDAGVPFISARADRCCLHELLRQPPDASQLNKLLPRQPDDVAVDNSALAVQATVFACGGVSIGLCFSHKAGDALSLVMFLRAWTAAVRGDSVRRPIFESAALFPPKSLSGYKQRTGIIKENISTKRFVFSAATIEALRERYTDCAAVETERRPTRFEALSAFIWTRFMEATQEEGAKEGSRLHALQQVVNVRQRMDPSMPENSFGNYYRIAVTLPSCFSGKTNSKKAGSVLVKEMREAMGKIDREYMRRVREGDEHLKFVKERAESATKGELVSFTFTSLCRFPLYEMDLGWGKPVWVASAAMPFKNLVSFLDSMSGDGIEAWINLREEEMERLEGDQEFSEMVLNLCAESS